MMGEVLPFKGPDDAFSLHPSNTDEIVLSAELIEWLTQVVDRATTAIVPDRIEVLAPALKAWRALRDVVAGFERELEGEVAAAMPSKIATFEGVGTFERKKGKDRKAWEHKAIAAKLLDVARRERYDTVTGEIQMSEGEAMMHTMLACAGIGYWKVTELRGRGIDPDEYAEVTPGRTSVVIV